MRGDVGRGMEFEVVGKSLNKEEFVTCGGVSVKDVDFRTMEWYALKSLMEDENISIDFDIPTEIELAELAAACIDDDEDDDEDELQPF